MAKWVPKKDTIGVPEEGFIASGSFRKEHLKKLIDRANNRNIPVDVFLSATLRQPIDGEQGIDDSDLKEDSEMETELAKDTAKEAAKTKAKDAKNKV